MRWTRSLVIGATAIAIGAATLPLAGAARGAVPDLPTGLTDPTFGVNGVVAPPAPESSWSAGEVAADGSLALGSGSTIGQFSASGVPDAAFGGDGLVDLVADAGLDLGGDITVEDITPVPGGALVVLIAVDTEASAQHLVALTATGSLDTGFAAAGATPGLVDLPPSVPSGFQDHRVVRQSSGRLVVVRASVFGSGTELRAYTSTGTPDTGFGSGGVATVPAATFTFENDWSTTFGVNGRTAAEVDGSDRIVLGGMSSSVGALVRLSPDGAPDTGFGSGGIATRLVEPTDIGSHVGSIVVDPSGRITAGLSGAVQGTHPTPWPETAALWRVDATGHDDATFGSAGVTILDRNDGSDNGVQTWAVAAGDGDKTWVSVNAAAGLVIGPPQVTPPYMTRVDASGVAEAWTRPRPLVWGGLVGMADGGALVPGVAERILPGNTGATPDYLDITVAWDIGPTVHASGWLTGGDIAAQRSQGKIVSLVGSGSYTDSGTPATNYDVTLNARSFLFLPFFVGSIQVTGGAVNHAIPLFFTGYEASARVVRTVPRWFYLTWNPFRFGSWYMDVTFYDGNA